MKKTIVTFIFAGTLALSCTSQKNTSSSSYSGDDDKRVGKHSITVNDEHGSLELKYAGEISFTDDETAVKSISNDGYLKYKKNGKKIAVTSEKGQLLYEINGGNKKTSLTNEEASLLAQVVKTMIGYGVGAKDRVERMYKSGGSKAVLNEVGKMKSDYVKGIYLDYLLSGNTLSSAEMVDLANGIPVLLESDYEKGMLLAKISSKYLADVATAKAYLNAVKSIGSDFEKANAVKRILHEPLSSTQFTDVLQVTNSIESDFEKANVLKAVLRNNKITAAQFSEVLKSVTLIESDFEKANILKDILQQNNLPEAQFNETLALVNSIESDFEKANLLKEVAGKEIKTEAQWISLINLSEKIDGDFEKSNLLVDIAAKMPAAENVKAAYLKVAKTISSDNEYGRVMRAVK